MEERIMFSELIEFLKSKIIKIIVVSVVFALAISSVISFFDREEIVYKTYTEYLLSYSDEVKVLDKEDLIQFLMSSGNESLEDFEKGVALNDYSIYFKVINEIIHSDYLYEKVKDDIDTDLDKKMYDSIVGASMEGAGRILTITSFHIDPEISKALMESINRNLNEACIKYFDCRVEILSESKNADILEDASDEFISSITDVLGHNYADRNVKTMAISIFKRGFVSFVAIVMLVFLFYSTLYVFRFGRFKRQNDK